MVTESMTVSSYHPHISRTLLIFLYSTNFRLEILQARDLAKLETEKARNNLETHIFEFKDKLTNDEVQALSTKSEREKIEKALSAASEWLDDEGFDADQKVIHNILFVF